MSSEHDVRVVRLGKLEKHPNADRLEVTEVDGRPVVTGAGQWKEGDLAVYVPIDSVVDTAPAGPFDFLATRAKEDGSYRIRAMRLRGFFSMGLLVKPPDGVELHDEVSQRMGIRQYEPPEETRLSAGGDDGPAPGCAFPTYTDIESHRKYHLVYDPDEMVVATEKIHGCNARYTWHEGRIYHGSRTKVKAFEADTVWHRAVTGELERLLYENQNITVFGEVYGKVQDLRYGVDSGVRFIAFDAYCEVQGRYLGYEEFVDLVDSYGVPRVPLLFAGRYSDLDWGLANGTSELAPGACIREGIVIRPVAPRRWHPKLGRVITKLVGEDYLTR